MMQQLQSEEWTTPSVNDKNGQQLQPAAQYERAGNNAAAAQVTTPLVTTSSNQNNQNIQNKPMQYREGVALEPSPAQGGIRNALGVRDMHAYDGVVQVENMGESVDTEDADDVDSNAPCDEPEDQGAVMRQLFGDDMDYDSEQGWLTVARALVSRRWQYETVTAAVVLLTGDNCWANNRVWHLTSEQEAAMDEWCPWVGSNMDRAEVKEGHVRLMALNPRVMAQHAQGLRDQQALWVRAASLSAEVVLLPDDGLVDPTLKQPKSTLVKAKALAAEAWGQRGLMWTHDQGQPGVRRTAVGGASLVVADTVASIQAQHIGDGRGWGRYSGRVLEGKDHRRLIVLTIHFPCETSGEGSAWQTQLRAMKAIAGDDRKANPFLQAVYDLQNTVAALMSATKSQQLREGTHLIMMGDFNARYDTTPGDSTSDKRATEALQSMARMLGLEEAMHMLHPDCRPCTYLQSDKQDANRSWIDFALVSKELLVQGLVTEAGVLQHEQLAGTDHRAYVIEVDFDSVLHLGQQW